MIRRISQIEDIPFLKAINTILDSKTTNETLILSDAQRDEIIVSKKEIEQGLFVEHIEFNKEITLWIKD